MPALTATTRGILALAASALAGLAAVIASLDGDPDLVPLLMVVTVWQGSSGPPPGPVLTYLGLPATVYHLVGLYGGWALVELATFGADRPPSD